VDLDYEVFAHVGLEAKLRVKESAGDKGGTPPRTKGGEAKPRGWVGILPKGGGTIATVLEGSPAMEAGLYPDDELVALDGFKVDCASLGARCEDKRPGEAVRITVFRRDRLIEVPLTLAAKPADAIYFAKVDKPTDAQKTAYQSWLCAPWDEPAP
jgi:predicted metalloprotease with PDZ domain